MSLEVNLSEPDEFNCVELHSCIDNVARLKYITEFVYHVEFACDKSENFVANVFRVTITDCENKVNEVSVIIKTLLNTERQELFQELHSREVKAYKDVLPKFESIQLRIPDKDRLALPVCILSDTQRGNEFLVLEDLLAEGFEYIIKSHKLQNLDKEQVGAILSELAKFHALSIVLQSVEKESFNLLKDEFDDVLFQESFLNKSKLKSYYSECYETSVGLITDSDVRTKLLDGKTKVLELLRDYTRPRNFNVLCHGDCWVNNLMFKRKDNTTKICFLDYQAMRYCNPATDIIYFLYLCTDSTFRSLHLNEVLLLYYESLEKFLSLFDISCNKIYPRDIFLDDVKEIMPYGFLIAMVELRIVSVHEEEKGETLLDAETSSSYECHNKLTLGAKINDLVEGSVENGLLNRIFDLI